MQKSACYSSNKEITVTAKQHRLSRITAVLFLYSLNATSATSFVQETELPFTTIAVLFLYSLNASEMLHRSYRRQNCFVQIRSFVSVFTKRIGDATSFIRITKPLSGDATSLLWATKLLFKIPQSLSKTNIKR